MTNTLIPCETFPCGFCGTPDMVSDPKNEKCFFCRADDEGAYDDHQAEQADRFDEMDKRHRAEGE